MKIDFKVGDQISYKDLEGAVDSLEKDWIGITLRGGSQYKVSNTDKNLKLAHGALSRRFETLDRRIKELEDTVLKLTEVIKIEKC